MPICQKCNNQFPNRLKIDGKVRVLNSRKFCLECSPFGKHNTKQLNVVKTHKVCPQCKNNLKLDNFYKRPDGTPQTYCKKCSNKNSSKRQRELKLKALEYLGNKCQHCGFDKHPAALQFHHVDKSEKEFTLSKRKCASIETIKAELDKCIILCANCHAIEHFE